MFCNKCGKTLNPEAKACPSCGQPVGDSRFEGSGYTSSQVRFVPDGPAAQTGDMSYTKTTYSSSPDEGDDVYARTTYRPVLSEDEGRETTGFRDPEPEETPEDGRPDEPEAPIEAEAMPRSDAPAPEMEPAPLSDEERDALGIEIRPLQPIRKTGISPEVQRYIQQMNQKKSRMKRKAHVLDGDEAQDTAEPGPADEGADHEDVAPKADERPARAASAAGRWAMRIGGALAVIVLLIVGVLFIVDRTANRAKIPGVSYSLYTEGLSLIKSHTTSDYRAGIIKMWRADPTGAAVMQQQKTESEQITALMPEKPLENDQLFIDTLLSIQESIDEVTATDALAALSAGETTLGTLSAESQQGWDLINNAITRLDIATDKADLEAIIKGVDISNIATPEPEATPTPSPYKTLKKGMKNNPEVKKLQNRLSKLGWFNGVKDGDFGPATQTSVKRFQKAAGLVEDGIATVEMQEILYSDNAPRGDGKVSAPAATESADEAETLAPEGGEGAN